LKEVLKVAEIDKNAKYVQSCSGIE